MHYIVYIKSHTNFHSDVFQSENQYVISYTQQSAQKLVSITSVTEYDAWYVWHQERNDRLMNLTPYLQWQQNIFRWY